MGMTSKANEDMKYSNKETSAHLLGWGVSGTLETPKYLCKDATNIGNS